MLRCCLLGYMKCGCQLLDLRLFGLRLRLEFLFRGRVASRENLCLLRQRGI
jgi:hypothetical protein